MNKGNDPLFQLIHSMSSSEKRYFKRNALIGGDTDANYLKLFDTLNKMKNYDEETLRKKAFVKHLAAERKYLYEAILRSLRNYNSEDSIRAQISDLLLDATYLYERGLYDQSQRRLKIAQRLVKQIDYLPAQLEINNMERLILRENRTRSYRNELEGLIEEKNEILVKLGHELDCIDLNDRIWAKLMRQYELKDEASKAALQQEFGEDFDRLAKLNTSAEGKRYFYSAGAYLNLLSGDYDKMEFFLRQILNWWEDREVVKNQRFSLYINALANYMTACFYLKRFDLIPGILENLDELKPKKYHDKRAAFLKAASNKLMYYLNTGKVVPIRDLIPEIEAGIKQYKLASYSALSFRANITVYHFLMEEWEDCLVHIEDIMKEKRYPLRENIQQLMRLLCVIVNFELGNIGRAEAELRGANRYFDKTLKRKTGFEFEALAFLRRLMATPLLEQKALFKAFDEYIERMNEEKQHPYTGIEELQIWVKSKLGHRSILEVYRDVLAQRN